MSFIKHDTSAKVYAPGYFLENDENCTRETRQIPDTNAVTVATGGKYVPMGTVFPSNDANAIGILYEDVDVTTGAMPGSVVTSGTVMLDKLPVALDSNAQSALEALGFKFITSTPAVTRPAWMNGKMVTLTVASVAGSASGKTKVTVSGYTLKANETYAYKTDASTAPTVDYGAVPVGWTAWNGTDDITATTGHKISVCVKETGGTAIALGSATVTSKT